MMCNIEGAAGATGVGAVNEWLHPGPTNAANWAVWLAAYIVTHTCTERCPKAPCRTPLIPHS